MIKQQEVEIKLRLESRDDYEKLLKSLGTPKEIQLQKNEFFDGSNKEITSAKGIFRLRFVDETKKCYATHKGKGVMKEGINSAEETEEEVDYDTAKKALGEPNSILGWDYELVKFIKDQYKVEGLVSLGGFENHRSIYSWENHKLEIDETKFSFDTNYEVEVETEDPVGFKQQLQQMLDKIPVKYHDSKRSKFLNFLNKEIAK